MNEREGTSLVVAFTNGLVQLSDTQRQQRDEGHPQQTDVQGPEGELQTLLRPLVLGNQVAQTEDRERDCEHTVHTHHGGVCVVCGQRGTDFEVGHDRQVDEEAEYACTEEVPEAHGDQEHHGPAVREGLGAVGVLASTQLHEAPCLNGQEGQRDNLSCGEERTECHLLGGGTDEVGVVQGTDHATDGVEHGVHHDDGDSDALADNAEQHEDVRHHHGGEQLEEVLHPEVNHPEAPELGDRHVSALAGEKADRVEHGNGQAREQEQPGEGGLLRALQTGGEGSCDDHNPDEHAHDEQNLEESRQVQELPLLREDGVGGDQTLLREPFVQQRAEDHEDHGTDEDVGQQTLLLGFAAGNQRGDEDKAGCLLRGGQANFVGLAEVEDGCLFSVPTDGTGPAAVDGEHQTRTTDEGNQGQGRPDHEVCGGLVVNVRLGGPVVGVGVGLIGAICCRGPCGPAEECDEVVQFFVVLNGVGEQALRGVALHQGVAVVLEHELEALGLTSGPGQGLGLLIVLVLLAPLVLDEFAGVLLALLTILLDGGIGGQAQVLCSVVGAEVGAVAEDGSVLLQAACLEEFLTMQDLFLGCDYFAVVADNLVGHRHGECVSAHCEDCHDGEAQEHHKRNSLYPALTGIGTDRVCAAGNLSCLSTRDGFCSHSDMSPVCVDLRFEWDRRTSAGGRLTG